MNPTKAETRIRNAVRNHELWYASQNVTGNARVIAKWPTTQKSTLTGIPLFSGPSWSTRVW